MSRYSLNAVAMNRVKKPGKLIDGSGLFFIRNKDGTFTPWQRVRISPGKDRDVKVSAPYLGEVSTEWLLDVRRRAHVLKTTTLSSTASHSPPFSELWAAYSKAVKRWSEETRTNYDQRMRRYVGPTAHWFKPIASITILDVEQAVAEARTDRPLLAPRILLDLRAAFAWAIARGEATDNPAARYLESLKRVEDRPRPEKLPALLDICELRSLLAAIETSNLHSSLRFALVCQALTVQRTGSVVSARWSDVDLDRAIWTVRRANLKRRDAERGDLVLALHPKMSELLSKIPRRSEWIFPASSNPKQHIAINQMARAMQRLGYDRRHVPHSWRASAKTLADAAMGDDDRPLFSARWVEDLLDHKVAGVEFHYNRARAKDGMAKILMWWGDQLSGGQATDDGRQQTKIPRRWPFQEKQSASKSLITKVPPDEQLLS